MALGVRNNDKEEVSSDPKARGIKSTNDRRWRKLKPTFCHFFPTLKNSDIMILEMQIFKYNFPHKPTWSYTAK